MSLRLPRNTKSRVLPALLPFCLSSLQSCTELEPLEEDADGRASSIVLLSEDTTELEPGEEVEIVAQALDVNGDPVDGASVFFLITETDLLSFNADDEGDFKRVVTSERSAGGLKASGLAIVSARAAGDAQGGTSKVVLGLTNPSESSGEAVVRVFRAEIAATPIEADGGVQ